MLQNILFVSPICFLAQLCPAVFVLAVLSMHLAVIVNLGQGCTDTVHVQMVSTVSYWGARYQFYCRYADILHFGVSTFVYIALA